MYNKYGDAVEPVPHATVAHQFRYQVAAVGAHMASHAAPLNNIGNNYATISSLSTGERRDIMAARTGRKNGGRARVGDIYHRLLHLSSLSEWPVELILVITDYISSSRLLVYGHGHDNTRSNIHFWSLD
jgi:hypothetical protein